MQNGLSKIANWAGEKQISYASPDGQYTYYVNKRYDARQRLRMERIIYMEQVSIMAGRRWTEDEVDYLEWYVLSREEYDLTQACKFLDRSYKAVRSKLAKLQKYNPNLQFKPKWSDADDSYILKYYQRFSYKTLARILGRSEKAIRDRIRNLGKRKILDLTIFHKDVVSLANQGMAVKDIAQKLGLHYNQVYYYLNKHQIPYKKQEFRNQSNNFAWRNLNDMVFMRRS